MLTIHKVSLRKINYYLELAREDYYLRGGEPPGVWHGRGAAAYGLNGLVNHAHFRNLFAGFSPDGQTAWVQNAGQETGYHTRCPGFDLTFSPPKSVSVLWSQSPEEIRQIIEKDHLKAVQTALSMMEQFAGVTRRGQGGKIWEKADFFLALFGHGTSRAQEQQLHTHSFLLNLARRSDGTTGALRSNAVFDYEMAIGALYRCQLAALLERNLNLTVEKVNTCFEIKGVSTELMDVCSTRRKQILAYCKQKGVYNAKEAEIAAIETRQVKGHIARELLFPHWREIGRQHGWSEKQALELLKAQPIERNFAEERERVVHAITEDLQRNPRKLTHAKLIELTAQQSQGTGLDAHQVLDSVRQIIDIQNKLMNDKVRGQSKSVTQDRSESHAQSEENRVAASAGRSAGDPSAQGPLPSSKDTGTSAAGQNEPTSKAKQRDGQKSNEWTQQDSNQATTQNETKSQTKEHTFDNNVFAFVLLKDSDKEAPKYPYS